jgi:hypothetical protein
MKLLLENFYIRLLGANMIKSVFVTEMVLGQGCSNSNLSTFAKMEQKIREQLYTLVRP